MNNPVPVKIKLGVDSQLDGLLYAIQPDESGVACGVCWLTGSKSWITIELASVEPILPNTEKKQLNE